MRPERPQANYRTIGLITGVQAEQHALLPDLRREPFDLNGLRVNRIEIPGDDGAANRLVLACTPGIGKVNAAGAAAALAATHALDLLAVIGTAGKINPKLSPTAYLLTEAIQADYGAYRDGEFFHYRAGSLPIGPPEVAPFVSDLAMQLQLANPDVASARIASGDSFVADGERSRDLHRATGADLVDMETAAVAQLAELMGLDWLAVKAVSDDANEESATSFAEQLAHASRSAARLFEQLLGLMP